jgi:hypothetical protein
LIRGEVVETKREGYEARVRRSEREVRQGEKSGDVLRAPWLGEHVE